MRLLSQQKRLFLLGKQRLERGTHTVPTGCLHPTYRSRYRCSAMKIPASGQGWSITHTYRPRLIALSVQAGVTGFFLTLCLLKSKNKAFAQLKAGTMATRTLYFFTENNIRYFIANLPVPEQPLGAEAVAPLVIGSAHPLLPHLLPGVQRVEN